MPVGGLRSGMPCFTITPDMSHSKSCCAGNVSDCDALLGGRTHLLNPLRSSVLCPMLLYQEAMLRLALPRAIM